MNIRCLTIDDEILARKRIRSLLNIWNEFKIVGEVSKK